MNTVRDELLIALAEYQNASSWRKRSIIGKIEKLKDKLKAHLALQKS
jgi:hypothetical protein